MKFWSNIYIRNLLLATLVIIILVSGILWWLNIYTHHNEAVVVPDVKRLKMEQASVLFRNNELRFEIIDSVYNKASKPGVIVETIPKAGTKVKKGRKIFLKINAVSAPKVAMPDVRDQSKRQAIAMLTSLGIKNIVEKYISGSYENLVINLEYEGKTVKPGERLPVNGQFTLFISSGNEEEIEILNDSDESEPAVDESWF